MPNYPAKTFFGGVHIAIKSAVKMPNYGAKTFFFGHRRSIDCKMPNFQAEKFVFGPLEWWWPAGTLMGLAYPAGRKVADPVLIFGFTSMAALTK